MSVVVALLCALALEWSLAPREARAASTASTASAVSLNPLAVVAAAADAIVASDPLNHLSQSDPFDLLAFQNDALVRAARVFATSDPARSQRYLTEAIAIADYEAQHDALERDGRIGWGLLQSWQPFGGSTDPANQIYAFQTGLVSWALLDTFALTRNNAYLLAVQSALANYAQSGAMSFAHGCSGCFMFWYSTNTNDVGRYVKNTNVLMGMAEARLFQLTGDPQALALANAVYNEESYEIVQNGNAGYLGVDDPKFIPGQGLDAHIVLETFGYSQIATQLGLRDSQADAVFESMTTTFWTCGPPCLATPITVGTSIATTLYAQFMACYQVVFNSAALPTCQRMYTNPNQTNLLAFPLTGLLYALPSLLPPPASGAPRHISSPDAAPRVHVTVRRAMPPTSARRPARTPLPEAVISYLP